MDKYVVFKGQNNLWYFHRKAENGEIVAASEGYNEKSSALSEAHRQADPENIPVVEVN